MKRFKTYLHQLFEEITTGGRTAIRGNFHEIFATHTMDYHLKKKKNMARGISESLFGTKGAKAAGKRVRGRQLASPTHPYNPVYKQLGNDETRNLFRTGLHTGAAMAHHVSSKYGEILKVQHVGKETAGGGAGVELPSGVRVKTPADVVVTTKRGERIKIIGKSIKLAGSSAGASRTKAFNPTLNTFAHDVDKAHERIYGGKYNGLGIANAYENETRAHTERENSVIKKHHNTLASVFGVNTMTQKKRGNKTVPAKYAPGSDNVLNAGAMSHIREIADSHPGIKKFYNELKSNNQLYQGNIANITHHALSRIFTGINTSGSSQHRRVAYGLYRKLNNVPPPDGKNSIRTLIVSTDETSKTKRPNVNIYDHAAAVESKLRKMAEHHHDFDVHKPHEGGSFRIGDLHMQIDSRPGSKTTGVITSVNNKNLKPVAKYTDTPTEPHHIGWKSLRVK